MSDATERINAWLHEATEGRDSVRIPELTDLVIGKLLGDLATLTAHLEESTRPLIYDHVQRFCARTRAHVIFADEVLRREELATRLRARRPRWHGWLERVGDKQIRLGAMTASDLEIAERTRAESGLQDLRLAALYAELRSGLRRGKKVEEVYTEERIDELARSMDVDWRVRRSEGRKEEAAD